VGTNGSPFDDEGVPCQPLTFVNRGVLQACYCDLHIAQQFQIRPSGNGFRGGLGNFPAPGIFNLILPETERSFADLLQQMGQGLVVDQVLGNGGGLSGDFSFNLDLGYWVEQGEIVGRVKDTMVAGNAYTALQQGVVLGGEREWSGPFYTPALWIESLTVTT
jgi:PmbA protein